MGTTIALTWFGLTTGNFLYQYFTKKDWVAAADRTFFQGIAVFTVWLVLTLNSI